MTVVGQRSRMTVGGESEKTKNRKGDNVSEIFASCTFSSLGLHHTLCDQLRERKGFEAPTLVQARAIPVVLSGRHVLVNAPTGTGKTVAYLAPIIHLLQQYDPRIQRSDGTFALVLVPTRELCMQVYDILQTLLHRFHWIVPGYIMGGENRSKEKARLRKGISILIATPGRLLDHLKNTSSFVYINLRWIIFDEADRVLDLGFGKEIEEILDHLGSRENDCDSKEKSCSSFKFKRQNLLLSATLNEKVNHLAEISLENPVMIGLENVDHIPLLGHNGPVRVGGKDEAPDLIESLSCSVGDYKIPSQLVQRYVKELVGEDEITSFLYLKVVSSACGTRVVSVPCGSRLPVLFSILKYMFERDSSQKVVVFFSTCDAVEFHYSLLSDFKFSPSAETEAELTQTFLKCKTFRLHGNMKPEDRRTTFQTFKSEKLALLLSTDVAARGLDFPLVRCIVQYDTPGEATEYVHRVGRTARLGERGDSLLFLQPVEIDYLQDLEKHGVLLTEYPLVKVLDGLPSYAQRKQDLKCLSFDLHPRLISLHRALESYVSFEPRVQKLAKMAFCSWVRAYTAHRGELKRFFTVKKLHLGHVAKSFALKEQPSLVGKSFQKEAKKRKMDQRMNGVSARSKNGSKRRRV